MAATTRQPGFHFSPENDALILAAIFLCEVVTKDHLTALTGRSRSSLDNRLPQLVANDYIRRTPFAATTTDKHGQKTIVQKIAYTLGKASETELAKILEKRPDIGTLADLQKQIRSPEPGTMVEHTLLISSIHVA